MLTVSLLEALSRAGKLGVIAAAQLDVARQAGAGVWRQARTSAARPEWFHAFYRQLWEDAAGRIGARSEWLGDGFMSVHAEARHTMLRGAHTALDGAVALQLAADKPVVHRLLSDAGMPVPRHRELDGGRFDGRLDPAPPVVVKPANDTASGQGVTPGLRTPEEVRRAVLQARRWAARVLLEEHIEGDIVRVLVLDGDVLAAVRKERPVVIGDGTTSVAGLIRQENERRAAQGGRAGMHLLGVDLDMLLTLRHAGLKPSTVPAAGARTVVKSAVNQNAPSDNHTVAALSVADAAMAVQAAEIVGLRLAGVDLVVGSRTVVLEVNGSPGLNHHILVADPSTAPDVAGPILRAALTA